jgi:class 3 adenylate cyclase/tetratricopeptide (TPR) repeat protein
MLFCDVKGSTSMAERLDPEEWAEIMNTVFGYLIPPVYRYEGVVTRLMGDAILAFFGAPVAHEDDPERAVRAGLDIVEGIRAYRERLLQERGLEFNVRVGINTGLVVVGEVGGGGKLEYTAMGDAINLAARMEQTASPGSVQVSEETYRLVEAVFETEPLGEIEVKGKRERVRAYRITGLKTGPGRSLGIHGRIAPLVGRQAELALMRRAAEKTQAGDGQIIFLIGEAGLGKTRLIEELRAEWQAALPGQVVYLGEVRGVSYAAMRPYEQFRQHLQVEAGIRETDTPAEVRARLEGMLFFASPEQRRRAMSVYPLLFNAQEEDGDGRDGLRLEGETFKGELFDVVLELMLQFAGQGPGMIVLEDLHWIDSASTDLLSHLLQLVRLAPILMVCAFRPDPQAFAWRLREVAARAYAHCTTEIVLRPLSTPEGEALIDHLLPDGQAQPAERLRLKERILEKAEGNPLFVEEVIHALLDGGGIYSTGDLTVPGSLQALLLARLDRLKEGPRRTLQLASVIGRRFSYRVLKELLQASPALEEELRELEEAGLIQEAARQPERQYAFRHALTQEAAYGSILLKRRRELHAQVGEALEALSAGRLEDQAAQLAHHFEAAGDERALLFHRMAGEQARRLYANEEAIAHFSHALELALQSGPDASTEEQIGLYRARGNVFYFLGRLSEASVDVEEALRLAREAGLEAEEIRLLSQLALFRWTGGRGSESLKLAQLAEEKAQAFGDPGLALNAAVILASAIQNEGEILAAHTRTRRALLISRIQKDRLQEATCLHFLGMQNNFMGRFGRAAACVRQAIALYLHLGEKGLAVNAHFFCTIAEGGRGDYDAALEVLEAGRALAQEVSSPWLPRYYNQRAWLSAELGDWETAYSLDLEGLEPARLLPGYHEILLSTQINLAVDCLALGRIQEAESYLLEAEKNVGRPEFGSHNWRWRTRLDDARARLFLRRGQRTEAGRAVERLLDWADHTRARKYTARGLILRAQIAQAGPALVEADLLAAAQMADTMCYYPIRIEARRQLLDLYLRLNAPEKIPPLLAELERLLDTLNESLTHPDLRRSFERGLAQSAT